MFIDIPMVQAHQSQFTRKSFVSYLQSMLRDYGGATLDSYELRMWSNLAVTQAAAFLRKHNKMAYRAVWKALPQDVANHPYKCIDMGQPHLQGSPDTARLEEPYPLTPGIATMIPYAWVNEVLSLTLDQDDSGSPSNLWRGRCEPVTREKFSAIANGLNDQWRQDTIWTQEGKDILFFQGSEVANLGIWQQNTAILVSVIRKPILDNLGPISQSATALPDTSINNYEMPVDLPEDAINLALNYAKRTALSALGKPEDPTTAQAIQMAEQSYLMANTNYDPAEAPNNQTDPR